MNIGLTIGLVLFGLAMFAVRLLTKHGLLAETLNQDPSKLCKCRKTGIFRYRWVVVEEGSERHPISYHMAKLQARMDTIGYTDRKVVPASTVFQACRSKTRKRNCST